MAAPKLYFIRHGQTDWNAEYRLQGQTDIPLNDKGRSQAARNGMTLAELIGDQSGAQFVASPLCRARETMEIVRRQLGLQEAGYGLEQRLSEVAFGAWEGSTWSELEAEHPAKVAAFLQDPWNYRPPGGESYADLTSRVMAWYNDLRQDTVAVAHGGVSRALRGHVLGLEPDEIRQLKVPQDKIIVIEGDQINWH